MKELKKVLASISKKNSTFRKKVENEGKKIKIRFSSTNWFYGWFGGPTGG